MSTSTNLGGRKKGIFAGGVHHVTLQQADKQVGELRVLNDKKYLSIQLAGNGTFLDFNNAFLMFMDMLETFKRGQNSIIAVFWKNLRIFELKLFE